MKRRNRTDRDRSPARRGRIWRRVILGVVLVASLVTVAVSVRQLLDLEERKEVADAATVTAGREEAELTAEAADLEALIVQLDDATTQLLATADGIDTAVADVVHLRAKVTTLTAEVKAARIDRDARQQKINVLLACRRTLDAAIDQLSGGHQAAMGASGVLDEGRATCQAAMEQVQGGTGAVHPYDFADPTALLVGDTYYAYATQGPGGAIQVLSSKDLRTWSVRTRALANRPAWARPGPIWAPSVHHIGGRYVLYYATRSNVSGQQCLSTAVSGNPSGPFFDDTTVPLICQDDLGGSIDPDIYLDEFGFAHITWKSEDETVGRTSRLWTQALTADGRAVNGLPRELLSAEDGWEQKTIENPAMVHLDGQWVLFYSGGKWNTDGYAVGYALCDGAVGPCHRTADARLHGSSGGAVGPGGADVFRTRGGRMAVVYAAWDRGKVGNPNGRRLHVGTVSFHDGAVHWRDL
ncbi:MAG: glycoside hydrolase, family 43 [Ilumatobacteraceae bacterium]|nr:glycoside hydrolase, family 43 [Ilumatobacteraceae bacterium]